MIICPNCEEEFEDNVLLLNQTSYDDVHVSLTENGDIFHDIIDTGKAEPADQFTCPCCWQEISDDVIREQLQTN